MTAVEFLNSFLLGLATPLTALCVIPLYPGFISYLADQVDGDSRRTYALFGILVVSGVISFMMMLGLVFSTLIQASLTSVIGIISPVAFIVLGVAGLAMILDLDLQAGLPLGSVPEFENPLLNAYGFGFFFGAVIVPCNPAFIATFLGRAFLFETPLSSLLNFLLFGLGIGFPLLAFSILSSSRSRKVVDLLQKYRKPIHRASGTVMLAVSAYYLIFVFRVVQV